MVRHLRQVLEVCPAPLARPAGVGVVLVEQEEAVRRFRARFSLADITTGRSPALAPLRIRSM